LNDNKSNTTHTHTFNPVSTQVTNGDLNNYTNMGFWNGTWISNLPTGVASGTIGSLLAQSNNSNSKSVSQLFISNANNKIYLRCVDADGSWYPWIEIGSGSGSHTHLKTESWFNHRHTSVSNGTQLGTGWVE
jgi:hypothetical protein